MGGIAILLMSLYRICERYCTDCNRFPATIARVPTTVTETEYFFFLRLLILPDFLLKQTHLETYLTLFPQIEQVQFVHCYYDLKGCTICHVFVFLLFYNF